MNGKFFLKCVWSLMIVFSVCAWSPGYGRLMQGPPPNDGPWNRDLLIAVGSDGTRFGTAKVFSLGSGVPSLIKDRQGRLIGIFQWFPQNDPVNFDRVAVRISEDNGQTWSDAQPIQVANLPSDYARPFDPTLTLLKDGRIRLYFTSGPSGGSPAVPHSSFYSAVSTDGVHYQFEPGIRFGVAEKGVIDCAVVQLGDQWHLCSPVGAPQDGAYHAVSSDGLNFTRLGNIPSVDGVNWTGNLTLYGDGMRFYGGSQRGIWWAFSKDGSSWTNPTYTATTGGDPAVIQVADTTFGVIYTGEPRTVKQPIVAVSLPASGLVVESTDGAQVAVKWAVAHSTSVAAQTVRLIGVRNGTQFSETVGSLAGTVSTFTYQVTKDDAVSNAQFVVEAADAAGNRGQGSSAMFTIMAPKSPPPGDTEKPVVKVSSPAAGLVVESNSNAQVSVVWLAADNVGVVNQTVKFTGSRSGTPFTDIAATGLPGTVGTFTLNIAEGDAVTNAQVLIDASDAAGNTGQGASGVFSIVAPARPDTEKPTVANVLLSKSKVKRKVDATVVISWTSADNQGVAGHDVLFAADGVAFTTSVISGLPGNAQQFTWTVPASLPKTRTGAVKVIARDAAGNVGEGVSRSPLVVK